MHFIHRSILLLSLLATLSVSSFANNGSIAYIYPVSNISIDGNLEDWPKDIDLHSMDVTHYGGGLKGEEDGAAHWRAGYDASTGHLYIGVVMIDNDYVKTPDDSNYTTHDFQVLYLDPAHTVDGAGVIGYEIDEHHRKIIEQESLSNYPQVADASLDQVELQIAKVGNTITYEWKVKITGPLNLGRVIGFDYAVFDKDTDEDHVMITWGTSGGAKFMNSNRIGDLVLLDRDTPIAELNGSLTWKDTIGEKWPSSIRLANASNPNAFFNVKIDSIGLYNLNLPAGTYDISVPEERIWLDWNIIDFVESNGDLDPITIKNSGSIIIDPIEVAIVPKPQLISDEGLMLSPLDEAAKRKTDEFIEAYRSYYNVPAVSLALIQNGELVYIKRYGVEDNSIKTPLRDNAVFEAASITKLVFSYAMNQIVQRGEFDLNKPLHETIPFYELEEEYPEYKQMTGKHVLTHVSGMPNWGYSMKNTPGTTYGYSGEAFEYLKRILVGEETDEWAQIVLNHLDKEVLSPLGMTNTYFMCNDQLADLKVAGHFDGVPNAYDCPQGPGMAWSMHTEASDFVKFAMALIERKGLTEYQAKKMFSFHTVIDEEDWLNGYKTGFGLGVALRESPHGLVYGHGGNNGDFRCEFEIYDELNTGYIVFTNADTAVPLLGDLRKFFVEGSD